MAATRTLTGNLFDLARIPLDAQNVRAVAVTNLKKTEALIDRTTKGIHLGGKPIAVDEATGEMTVGLIDTAATDLNVVANTVQYEIRAVYVDPASAEQRTWRSGWFSLTANRNLADIAADVSPMAVASASAFAQEAAGYRDQAAQIALGDAAATIDARVAAQLAADTTVKAAASAATGAAIYNDRPAKNKFNPSDPDLLVDRVPRFNSAGNYDILAGYTTSGFIPVTAGQSYAITNARYYEWWNASKVSLGPAVNTGNVDADPMITAPTNAAYLRTTYLSAYVNTHQVEQGTTQTSYEPYYPGTRLDVDPQFAYAVGQAVDPKAGPVLVTKTGNTVTLAVDHGTSTLVQSLSLIGSSNGSVNLSGVTLGGSTIHPQNDEVTPIRTQMGTVGANHGYSCVRAFANPDGKTTADIGSRWTDGTREYVLLDIDAAAGNVLIMGGSYATTGGVVTSADVAPIANLTHVAGATKTAAIVYTTAVARQLYPSIGRLALGLYVDGVQVTATNTTLRGNVVEVRESYDVLDYASIYDTAKANIGVRYSTLPVAGAVRVTNRFAWRGAECRITTSLVELKPTTLGACGAIQAVHLAKSGATNTRYLPGVGTVSGFNWTAGVDMTSYATTVFIATGNLTATGTPPALALDVLRESGTVTVGFAMGYLAYGARGDEASRNTPRITKAPTNLWEIRSTKKSYPTITTGETAGWGRLGAESFRRYLTPAEVAQVLGAKDQAVSAVAALGYA